MGFTSYCQRHVKKDSADTDLSISGDRLLTFCCLHRWCFCGAQEPEAPPEENAGAVLPAAPAHPLLPRLPGAAGAATLYNDSLLCLSVFSKTTKPNTHRFLQNTYVFGPARETAPETASLTFKGTRQTPIRRVILFPLGGFSTILVLHACNGSTKEGRKCLVRLAFTGMRCRESSPGCLPGRPVFPPPAIFILASSGY